MPCPTWTKSRTIRLCATWSDWFVSEMMRAVSVMSMPFVNAPRPAPTTTSVSAVEMIASMSVKPASCCLRISRKVRRQNVLSGPARRAVGDDDPQLAEVRVDVADFDLTREAEERRDDV